MGWLKQAGIGFGVFFASLIVELIVSLPFNPANLTLELGLAAPVMLGLTYLLATLLKTGDARQGLTRGVLWALVVGAMYAIIGSGGQETALTRPTFYLLVACIAVGPVLAGRAAGQRTAAPAPDNGTAVPLSPASPARTASVTRTDDHAPRPAPGQGPAARP